MLELLYFISAGAIVGLAVGLTGVGGGSLMTPFLILFGIPYHVAIGTDLLYAAITKAGGMVTHARQKKPLNGALWGFWHWAVFPRHC